MPYTSRYNGNHNNLILSLGAVNKQEREKIKSINLQHYGRPYLVLTFARMQAPNHITFQDIQKLAPKKFDKENKYIKAIEELEKNNLIEQNPDHPKQHRITHFGVKFLYMRKQLSYRR